MKAAYTGTSYRGKLTLECFGSNWRSERSAPLGVSVIPQNDILLAIPSDASGGLRGGDRHNYTVKAGRGAKLQWSVPASTLFHPSAARKSLCEIDSHINMQDDAELRWLAKPNIPCAGSRVHQHTAIDIESGSELLYTEFWAPGRHGEHWAFAAIRSTLELRVSGLLRFKENWTLEPDGIPHGPAGLHGCHMWGILLANGPKSQTLVRRMLNEMKQQGARAEYGDVDDTLALARLMFPLAVDPIWKNLVRLY